MPLGEKGTYLSVPGTGTSASREMTTSLASEDSLCKGRKEGFLWPSSWGLSDCGVRRHSHRGSCGNQDTCKLLSVTVKMPGIMAAPTVGCSLCTRVGSKPLVHELTPCPECCLPWVKVLTGRGTGLFLEVENALYFDLGGAYT